MYREIKWKQFLNLKQMNLSVVEYEKEFNHLSKYAPESVLTEAFRCRQFEDGLNESIKRYMAPVIVLQQVNFYQLVQAAMKVEKSEASSRERFQKRKDFIHLSKYAPESVLTEVFRCRQFVDGLNESIKRYMAPMIVLQQVNFYQLVQAAMKVEKSEASSRERFQKRKLSRGASSSSGKRAKESQIESTHSFATRGKRQGNTVVPSNGRGASAGPGETLECTHCH